ncbi:hypothetical protein HH308_03400 [Gordonia sp. TBRC 11910]|uniref:Uncharacterized protein n=1 Tax=Gordonia asplenii TaxID=2725283 RepID=A0A848KQP7_9ACTN|nr:hypothetical protein [Gordonia asplenii]NMO00257.1 hypothetical protein [Gordonia asplenii]
MAGSLAYTVNDGPISATGHLLEESDVTHIAPSVQSILRDETGVQEAREALADLAQTDFENERLESILAPPDTFEEWRAGEALAEHHLTTEAGCEFPWPDSRSTRNPNSSGGGVDLIGFHVGDRVRFVFAEVKTSHQQAWPPALLTSRSHGLHSQMAGLNAGDDRSKWAIRYLAMNSVGKSWIGSFRQAMETYLADCADVVIFGVLIHASEPNQADLRARASSLAPSVKVPTRMALIAIYLTAELLARVTDGSVILETAA